MRKYLIYLEEAQSFSSKTTDQVVAALSRFEKSTKGKDFAAFHIEQAHAFKGQQSEMINCATGKPIAKATLNSRLNQVKAYFVWLADQQVNLVERKVFQDARDVRTKFRKSFETWFLHVGDEPFQILSGWISTMQRLLNQPKSISIVFMMRSVSLKILMMR